MSWAIWITGLPGSGKSALARAAAAELAARDVHVKVLELDVIRKILTPLPSYSDVEREAAYRMLAFMAATLVDNDIPVIIDATAHRRHWRDFARRLIPRFAEVQLHCPLAVCREREASRPPGNAPRNIYATGGTVPGVGREYEPALSPELTIDTAAQTVASGAGLVVALAHRLGAGPSAAPRPDGGWAIWITGRPGSGKTTLAHHAASALAARGLSTRLVEATPLRRLVGPMATVQAEDLVHRAVVCLAQLLVEAGFAVVVDATGHQRRWRDLARDLIPRFAEIQLSCPPEICAERERATRWHLGSAVPDVVATRPTGEDEWSFDYEFTSRAELVIHTDVQDWTTAVKDILFVAQGLDRRSRSASRLS